MDNFFFNCLMGKRGKNNENNVLIETFQHLQIKGKDFRGFIRKMEEQLLTTCFGCKDFTNLLKGPWRI